MSDAVNLTNLTVPDNLEYQRVCTVEHRGTIVTVAEICQAGVPGFVYTTRGAASGGWAQIQGLDFPKSLRSAGRQLVTLPDVADASSPAAPLSPEMPGDAWHLHSDGRYIYLFRAVKTRAEVGTQSALWSIWVNRFLLVARPGDGAQTAQTTVLLPRHEARFQGSGIKDVPESEIDKSAFKAPDGRWFDEPTLEVTQSSTPWFAVEQTPSDAGVTPRWLLFAMAEEDGTGPKVRALSMLTDETGLPLLDEDTVDRTFALKGQLAPAQTGAAPALPLTPVGVPHTTSYRRQEETPDPQRSGPTELRVMLASRVQFDDVDTPREAMLAIDFGLDDSGAPGIPETELTVGTLGHAKTALSFDGQDDALTISFDRTCDLRNGAQTLEVWVRPAPGGTVTWWGDATSKTALQIYWDPEKRRPWASVPFMAKSGTVLPPSKVEGDHAFFAGVWHHLSLVIDPHDWTVVNGFGGAKSYTVSLFVDGILQKSQHVAPPDPADLIVFNQNGAFTLIYGRSPDDDTGPAFVGDMDELVVWKSALTAELIEAGLRSTYTDKELKDAHASGYWQLDDGLADPGVASARVGPDGVVSGATWTTRSAPVFDAGLAQATRKLFGFASGLGLLPPSLSNIGGHGYPAPGTYADPTLLNGADGVVHLYLGQGTDEKSLYVMPYDTTIARAFLALPTRGRDDKAASPLYLAGQLTGPLMNDAAAEMTAGAAGHLDVALQATNALGLRETYKNVPDPLTAFSQVINGAAGNDPLAPKVRSGAVPYYDYSGQRPFVRLTPTVNGTPARGAIQLVTAQLSDAPSALRLDSATLAAEDGKVMARLGFVGAPFAAQATTGAGEATEDRALNASIVMHGLSPDAGTFAEQLSGSWAARAGGAPDRRQLDGARLMRLPGVFGSFYLMHAEENGAAWSLAVSAGGSSATCTVELGVGATTATWTDVPRDPVGFAARLNLRVNPQAPDESQRALAKEFVVLGTNVSGLVGDGQKSSVTDRVPDDEIDFAAFFNLIAPDVEGTMNAGTFPAGPGQGKATVDATGSPVRNTAHASEIFAAAPPTDAAKDEVRVLQAGTGKLVQPGNFGGWLPVPATLAGHLAPKGAQAVSVTPADKAALEPDGDFTFEAWLRPENPAAGAQRLLNSALTAPRGLSVGLADMAFSYGLRAGPGDTGVSLEARLDQGGTALLAPASGQDTTIAYDLDLDTGNAVPGREYQLIVMKAGFDDGPGDLVLSLFYAGDRKTFTLRLMLNKWGGGGKSWSDFPDIPVAARMLVWLKMGPIDSNTHRLSFGVVSSAGAWTREEFYVRWSTMNSASLLFAMYPSAVGPMHQAALWTSWVDKPALAGLFGQDVSPSSANLMALWRPVDWDAGKHALPNVSQDREAPVLDLQRAFREHVIEQVTTARGHMLYARTGGRRFGTLALPGAKAWHHVAVVCSDNDAVAFDGTAAATVKNGEELEFDEAFGIDAFLSWSRGIATERVICAKHFADDPGYAEGGYALFVTADGRLALRARLSDGTLVELEADKALPSGQPLYVFATARIFEATAGVGEDIEFSTDPNDPSTQQGITPGNKIDTRIVVQLGFWPLGGGTPERWTYQRTLATSTTGQTITFASTTAPFVIGGQASSSAAPQTPAEQHVMSATLATLRLWQRYIIADLPQLRAGKHLPSLAKEGLLASWRCDEGSGMALKDSAGGADATLPSADMWTTAPISSQFAFYVDGVAAPAVLLDGAGDQDAAGEAGIFTLGAVQTAAQQFAETYDGALDEVRLWAVARTADEIRLNAHVDLAGDEPGLAAYWPVMAGSGAVLRDRTGRHNDGLIHGSLDKFWASTDDARPVGREAPQIPNLLSREKSLVQVTDARTAAVATESGIVSTDDDGQPGAVMARFYAYVDTAGRLVFIDAFPVGDAWLNYLGQAQSDPTLIGYIEGAPPVPGENLTRPYWISPATWQTYDGLSQVTLSEAEEVDYVYAANKDTGFDMDIETGFGAAIKIGSDAEVEPLGLGVSFDNADVDVAAGGESTLSLQQGWLAAAQRQVGTRRGKESSFAAGGDWELDSEQKTGRYVLDNTGFALVRSSVANVYGLRLKKTNTLIGVVMNPDPDIAPDFNLIHFPIDPLYTKQGTLDGMVGFDTDDSYPEANLRRGSYYKPKEVKNLEDQIEQFESELEADFQSFNAGKKGRRQSGTNFKEGDDPVADPGEALDDDLTVSYDFDADGDARNRRNLVNTYVWSADGGLFAETEQTTARRQETHGGSYQFAQNAGVAAHGSLTSPVGVYLDAKALFGGHIMSTVEKSKEQAAEFALAVTDDVESYLADFRYLGDNALPAWQPDEQGAKPGKVDAFRFKTFYLAPADKAFRHFFGNVVDQEWLETSDDRAARALREAQGNRAAVWRVLHRVTYVSRVPPPFNRAPDESVTAPSMPVINVPQNQLLVDAVGQALSKQKGSDPLETRIVAAVDFVLNNGLGPVLPWWPAFAGDAAADAVYQRLKADMVIYMSAYAEDNPDWAG